MIDERRRFRDCLGRFATGVTVVIAAHDGDRAGMTVNSFTSVSVDPLLVLVSLAHGSRTLGVVDDAGRFTVSVLHRQQEHVARDFARPGAPFPEAHVVSADDDLAVAGAVAVLRCRVVDELVAGDHTVVVGAVDSFAADDRTGDALVFHRGMFGGFHTPNDSATPPSLSIGMREDT